MPTIDPYPHINLLPLTDAQKEIFAAAVRLVLADPKSFADAVRWLEGEYSVEAYRKRHEQKWEAKGLEIPKSGRYEHVTQVDRLRLAVFDLAKTAVDTSKEKKYFQARQRVLVAYLLVWHETRDDLGEFGKWEWDGTTLQLLVESEAERLKKTGRIHVLFFLEGIEEIEVSNMVDGVLDGFLAKVARVIPLLSVAGQVNSEAAAAVRLGEGVDSREVWVFNRPKGEVSKREAAFLRVLLKYFPERIKGVTIECEGGNKSDAAHVLKQLKERDADWKAAILLAGAAYGKYGIAPMSADPLKQTTNKKQKTNKKTKKTK